MPACLYQLSKWQLVVEFPSACSNRTQIIYNNTVLTRSARIRITAARCNCCPATTRKLLQGQSNIRIVWSLCKPTGYMRTGAIGCVGISYNRTSPGKITPTCRAVKCKAACQRFNFNLFFRNKISFQNDIFARSICGFYILRFMVSFRRKKGLVKASGKQLPPPTT